MKNTKRLFVAIHIKPSTEFIEFFDKLKLEFCTDKITWTRIENTHITLCFIGETNINIIPQIIEILNSSIEQTSKTTIKLAQLGFFGFKYKPKVIWLGVNPENSFKELTNDIFKNFTNLNLYPTQVNFIPHITLGRIKDMKDPKQLHKFISNFNNKVIQTCIIEDIYLYESILDDKKPPVYKEIATFKLA